MLKPIIRLVCGAALMGAFGARAQSVSIEVGEPGIPYTGEVGDELAIEVNIDNDVDLWQLFLNISFDTSRLEFVSGSVTWGDRVKTGESFGLSTGVLALRCDTLDPGITGISATGSPLLASFTLRCIAGGDSQLTPLILGAKEVGSFWLPIETTSATGNSVSVAGPQPILFSPPGGDYAACQDVSLSSADSSSIYYTTDGTDPDKTSSLFDGTPVPICGTHGDTVTLKVAAYDDLDRRVPGVAEYTFDFVGPQVTVDQDPGQPDPTNQDSVLFLAVFSEAVVDFDSADVVLGGDLAGSGTVSASQLAPGDGTTWRIAVNGIAGEGLLTATIPAAVCTDTAGNSNAASTSTDNQVTRDTTPPGSADFLPPHNVDGTYAEAQTVYLSVPVDADSVHYTLDGTFPSMIAPAYDAGTGIAVDAAHGETVRVRIAAYDLAGNFGLPVRATDLEFDKQAPIGYTISFDTVGGYINAAGQTQVALIIASSPETPAAQYNYTISDDSGRAEISGGGTITGAKTRIEDLDVSLLAEGTLTATVILTDWLGNDGLPETAHVTKDTVPPAAPTFSIPDWINLANHNDFPLAGNAEPHSIVGYQFTDTVARASVAGETTVGGDGAFSTGVNVSVLSDGAVQLSAIATDPAGNPSAAGETDLVKDTVAPSPLINYPEAGIPVNGLRPIEFTVDDPHAPQVSIDGVNWYPATSGQTRPADLPEFPALAEGASFDLYVRDFDLAGNQGADTAVGLIKDTTAPTVVLSGCPSGPIMADEVSLSVSGDQVVGFDYRLDGGAFTGSMIPVTMPIELQGLADGEHSLAVIGVDEAGNWQDTAVATTCVWTVDTLAPQNPALDASDPAAGSRTRVTQVDLEWRPGSDPGGSGVEGYSWSVDMSPLTSPDEIVEGLPDAFNMDPAAEGDYYLHVITVDKAGNWSAPTHFGPWTLDRTPPTAVLSNLPPRYTAEDSVSISVSGTDVVRYRFQINGLGWGGEMFPFQPIVLDHLPAGDYMLEVIGADVAGNWQPQDTATEYLWTVEFTIPTNPGVSSPASDFETNASDLPLAWQGDDPEFNTGFAIALDLASDTDPGTVVTDTELPGNAVLDQGEASYWLHIRTLARNGLWSEASHFGPWILDQTPPTMPQVASPLPGLIASPETILLNVDPSASVTRFTNDGSVPGPANDVYLPGGLAVTGGHGEALVLNFRSYDLAGNASAVAVVTYTFDTQPPAGQAISFDSGQYINRASVSAVTLSVTGAEVGSAYHCTLSDNAGRTEWVVEGTVTTADFTLGPADLSNLADGPITADLILVDSVGNEAAPVSDSAIKDSVAPDQPGLAAVTDPVNAANAVDFEFNGTAEPESTLIWSLTEGFREDPPLAGEIPVPASGDFNVTGLDVSNFADGRLTLALRARDPAGNIGSETNREIAKDTIPPALAIVSPATAETVNGAVLIVFTNDDPHAPEFSVDGSHWYSVVSGTTILGSATEFAEIGEGESFVLLVRDTDAAGNSGQASAAGLVKDTIPPDPPVIDAPAPGEIKPPKTAALTVATDAAVTTYTLDGSAPDTNSMHYSPPGVELNGQHGEILTLSARSFDAAGNGTSIAQATYILDAEAPAGYGLAIEPHPYINAENSETVMLRVSTAEVGANYAYTMADSGGRATISGSGAVSAADFSIGPLDISGFADGNVVASIVLTDGVGNQGDAVIASSFKDGVAPVAPAVTALPAAVNAGNQNEFGFSGTSEAAASVAWQLAEVALRAAPIQGVITANAVGEFSVENVDLSGLADGLVQLSLAATDLAGNTGPTLKIDLPKDTVPPQITITSPGNGEVVNGLAAVFFSNTETTSAELSVNGLDWVPAVSGETTLVSVPQFAALAEGSTFDLTVRDTDPAGNPGTAVVSNLKKDTTPPDAPVVSSPAPGTVKPPQNVVLDLAPDAQLTTYTTDGTDPTLADSPYPPTGITINGAHGETVTVRASTYDEAGNRSPVTQATYVFDSLPPAGHTISFATGDYIGAAFQRDAAVNVVAAEVDAAYACTISDGGARAEVVVQGTVQSASFTIGPLDLSGLADGPVTASLVLTDPAGNVAPAVTTLATKDTVPPLQATIDVLTDPVNALNQTSVSLAGKAEPDMVILWTASEATRRELSGSATVLPDGTYSVTGINLSALADGEVNFGVLVRDAADNYGPINVKTINKDTVPPALAIISPEAGKSVNGNASLVFEDDDPGAPEFSVDDTNWHPAQSGVTVLADATEFAAIPDGAIFTLHIRDTDSAGNVGTATAGDLTKDTTAPDAPEILGIDPDTAVGDDLVTSAAEFTVIGTAEAGAAIELFVDGEPGGEAEVDANGNWQILLDSSRAAGTRLQLTAVARDDAGNRSPFSEAAAVIVDTSPPVVGVRVAANQPADRKTIHFVLELDEVVVGVDESDFVVQNGTVRSLEAPARFDAFIIVVVPDGDGEVCMSLPGGIWTDIAGNPSTEVNPVCLNYVMPWTASGQAFYEGEVNSIGYAAMLDGPPGTGAVVTQTDGFAVDGDGIGFELDVFDPGQYHLIVYLDENANQQFDPTSEPYGVSEFNPLSAVLGGQKALSGGEIHVYDWHHQPSVHKGWCAISLPGIPAVSDIAALFPEADPHCYVWHGEVYGISMHAPPLTGFWLYFADVPNGVSEITGYRRQAAPARAGWQFTGVAVESTVDPQTRADDAVLAAPVWLQNGPLVVPLPEPERKLFPGNAYWFLVDQPGPLPITPCPCP